MLFSSGYSGNLFCHFQENCVFLRSLEVLWKAQVLLQSVIDCEAYRSGWDDFDVIQAQASKERSGALLLDDHAQALQCRPYLLPFLLVCPTLLQVLQPLHLQNFTLIKRVPPSMVCDCPSLS